MAEDVRPESRAPLIEYVSTQRAGWAWRCWYCDLTTPNLPNRDAASAAAVAHSERYHAGKAVIRRVA